MYLIKREKNESQKQQLITSLENKKIKEIGKLRDKKYRDKTNLFLVETENLIQEAYKNNQLLEVYKLEEKELNIDIPYIDVTPQVMKKIKGINTSSMIGICKKKPKEEIGNRILLLDGIGDPGNLGTILRSAVAFNINTIILSNDTVDLYNDKVIRASEGMLFNANFIKGNLKEIIPDLKNKGYKIYGTNVENGLDLKETSFVNKVAVIIGNEGNGVKKALQDKCDSLIYIPISSTCESLNVGVATSILLYELNNK